MFVTSDIFDLKRIGKELDFDWHEVLLAGVGVHSPRWPGYRSAARFLHEAGKRCDLLENLVFGDYRYLNDMRRGAALIFEPLARGYIIEPANNPFEVELGICDPIEFSRFGATILGGKATGALRRDGAAVGPSAASGDSSRTTVADFVFRLDDQSTEVARDLFRLSIELLGAEYGYYFIRDEVCRPPDYSHGAMIVLDDSELVYEEAMEAGNWYNFQIDGLWSGKWPLLRDIYEMNLISERHTSAPIDGLGYLTEWISAQAGRGNLEDLGEGRLLWTLTDAEMFNVRPLLIEAGLLLSCRDRVYRDLPGGAAHSPTS